MNYSGWPNPPIATSEEPPAIPERLSIFGTFYRTVDGNLEVDMPNEPLDEDEVRRMVRESFEVFLKLIKTADTAYLTEIGELHSTINEKINKAKAYKSEEAIDMAKVLTIERKKTIIAELKRLMK